VWGEKGRDEPNPIGAREEKNQFVALQAAESSVRLLIPEDRRRATPHLLELEKDDFQENAGGLIS